MKKFVPLLLVIVCLAALLGACDDRPEYTFNNVDRCEYVLDESGHHVGNINFDDYLSPCSAVNALDVRSFGASTSASPETNQRAINAAISQASGLGGSVIVSGGTYYTGTVTMLSDVTLYIDEGAELSVPAYDDLDEDIMDSALIKANAVNDWSICGPGKLNGQGTDYTNEAKDGSVYYPPEEFSLKDRVLDARDRIRERKSVGYNIIYAFNCRNISLSNLVLHEASTWTVKLERCNGVTITDLVIDNNIHVANSDGIDIVSSKNVNISHCFIATGDDGIVIKSPSDNVENVFVDDCSIMSLANNFKIGTETGFDVKNVEVGNCYFFTAECAGGYSGIAIESADGADLSDIYVHDIVMDNVTSALLIWLGYRLDKDKGSTGKMGSINGVTIENIDANNIDLPSAAVGCEYDGARYRVQNVTIKNVTAVYRDCYEDINIYKGDSVLEANMDGYPEITRVSHKYIISHSLSRYYDLPCYGLYVRDAENFTLENFNVTPRQGNTRPMLCGVE